MGSIDRSRIKLNLTFTTGDLGGGGIGDCRGGLEGPEGCGRGVDGQDFDVGHRKDAQHSVPLPLVPVVVHLALDVDQVAFLEAQLTVVLGLQKVTL